MENQVRARIYTNFATYHHLYLCRITRDYVNVENMETPLDGGETHTHTMAGAKCLCAQTA